MQQKIIERVRTLRAELHSLAELSGQEHKTKAHLEKFLQQNTTLQIDDRGAWFCALHQEPSARETIAFRADMDAVPVADGGAAHLCGHDGHSAVLAGLGLLLEGMWLGKNIVLIFQHAEETGEGARACCRALEDYRVSSIYAFHNIPGWPAGTVLLRSGTFACASMGMMLTFSGVPSHAAYPENGVNPGYAAARVMAALPKLLQKTQKQGLTMATLIGSQIGAKAFGTAAGRAEVWLTLRAWHEADMLALRQAIEQTARDEARQDGVAFSCALCDVFPATVNDNAMLAALERVCRQADLACIDVAEPFRWSEDFGCYGSMARAVLVGIGAGESWPQLHTPDYCFNDEIIPQGLRLFFALAQGG